MYLISFYVSNVAEFSISHICMYLMKVNLIYRFKTKTCISIKKISDISESIVPFNKCLKNYFEQFNIPHD